MRNERVSLPLLHPASDRERQKVEETDAILRRHCHDDDLVAAIGAALERGGADIAFELADRLCRLKRPVPAGHRVLKAIAARRLGLVEESAALLRRAMQDDPTQLPAARLALDWLPAVERRVPAERILCDDDSDPHVLRAAAILSDTGAGRVHLHDANGVLRLRLLHRGAKANTVTLRLDAHEEAAAALHPQTRSVAVAAGLTLHELRLARPQGPCRADLVVSTGSEIVWSQSLILAHDPADRFDPEPAVAAVDARPILNVIVPLYDDVDATRRCLDSLAAQATQDFVLHVILVEDAAPDPRIGALAETWGRKDDVTVIRNPLNLGFAGAINRGLRACRAGDVVLLNADTVLPVEAMARLRAVAHANPDAGTLTPFTNNGQYTSFPMQYEAGPVPDGAALETVAEAAYAANATETVALPSGIGFCLYIREAAMREAGRLSEEYGNGYYEDVDLCLRIGESGWRNMCATGVFVGHVGSRSFGAAKSHLVARNRARLDRSFPIFASLSAHMVALDPLRPFRARIEARLPGTAEPIMLTIGGEQEHDYEAEAAPGPQTSASASSHVCATVARSSGRPVLATVAPAPAGLANLSLELRPEAASEIAARLALHGIERLVITDPLPVDPRLVEALVSHGIAVAVDEADAGLFCPRGSLLDAEASHCAMPADPAVCDACIARAGSFAPVAANGGVATWRARWAKLVFGEANPSPQVYRARWRGLGDGADARGRAFTKRPTPRRSQPRLALVGGAQHGLDTRFLVALCTALSAQGARDCVVLSGTLDDARLLALPGIFVTGHVEPNELAELAACYGITHAMVGTRRYTPFDPSLSALSATGIPTARFDLSVKRPVIGPSRSLSLPFTIDEDAAARELLRWMTSSDVVHQYNAADDTKNGAQATTSRPSRHTTSASTASLC